jgi:hypothetical protein
VDDLEAVGRVQWPTTTPGSQPGGGGIDRPRRRSEAWGRVTSLPAVFRDTLVLRDVQSLDYREIATITGVPIGTVMSRLARARSG